MSMSAKKFSTQSFLKFFLIATVLTISGSGVLAFADDPCTNLGGKFLATVDAKTKILFEVRQEVCNYGFVKSTSIDERGTATAQCPVTVILDNKQRLIVDDLTGFAKVDNNGFSGTGKTSYAGVPVTLEAKARLDGHTDLGIDVVVKTLIGIVVKRVHLLAVRQAQDFVLPPTERRLSDGTSCQGPSFLELLLSN